MKHPDPASAPDPAGRPLDRPWTLPLMLAELDRERSASRAESERSALQGCIDGLKASPDASLQSILATGKSGLILAGFLGGMLQAAMARRLGPLSTEQFRLCGMYCAAICGNATNLTRLGRDVEGVAEAHALAVAYLNEQGIALSSEDDQFFVGWLADRAGFRLSRELASRLIEVRKAFHASDRSAAGDRT